MWQIGWNFDFRYSNIPAKRYKVSKCLAPNGRNGAAVLLQWCRSIVAKALCYWQRSRFCGFTIFNQLSVTAVFPPLVAVMLQYFCTHTTWQQHKLRLKTKFTVLTSFTTVHMHLYLSAPAIPPQSSHYPTIKIENLPNLLWFFKIF